MVFFATEANLFNFFVQFSLVKNTLRILFAALMPHLSCQIPSFRLQSAISPQQRCFYVFIRSQHTHTHIYIYFQASMVAEMRLLCALLLCAHQLCCCACFFPLCTYIYTFVCMHFPPLLQPLIHT